MAFRSVSIVASETSIITAEGHHRESGSNQPAPFYTQHSSANQSLRHAQPLTGTKRQHADPVVSCRERGGVVAGQPYTQNSMICERWDAVAT
jgi:hypothetical protein